MFSTRYYICRVLRNSSISFQNWKSRTKTRCNFSSKILVANGNCVENSTQQEHIHCQTICNVFNQKSRNRIILERATHGSFVIRAFSSAVPAPSTGGEQLAFALKPEINFEILETKVKEMEVSVKLRDLDVDLQEVLTMWKEIKRLEQQKIQLESERKKVKFTKRDKISDEDKKKAKAKGTALREELRSINSSLSGLTDRLYPMALKLPNFLHKDVPCGSDPVELDLFTGHGGELKKLKFKRRNSHEYVHPGFVYLEDECALLEQALLSWAAHQLHKKGFTRYSSPDMYKPIALEAVGIGSEENNQTYAVKTHEDISYLAGSSAMAFAAYFMMSVLAATDFPQRCFTVGRHYNSKYDSGHFDGFHRNFQTNTIEVCGLCEESTATSEIIYNQYVSILKDLYSELPLKCRLVEVPASGLLPSMYRKCALQVWLPNSAEYVEAACVYNCTDYISRRLKIRHLAEHEDFSAHKTQRRFVHTVHGKVLNTGVLIEAFQQLAQNQDEVCIPSVILPYMPKSSATTSASS